MASSSTSPTTPRAGVSQDRPQPPRLIITPSTPVAPSVSQLAFTPPASDPSKLPSPRNSRGASLYTISEKRRARSASRSRSGSVERVAKEKIPPLPLEAYLAPPSHLPQASTGKRPLRSPLISILFLLCTFLLVLSTLLCTTDHSVRFLELQQKGMARLSQTSRSVGDIVRGSVGGAPGRLGSTSPPLPSTPCTASKQHVARGGIILNEEEWNHYTSIIGGPAMSIGGQVWDLDW
ncbi:hypothetical protein IAU60_004673 [Kwoniella sp. DSM 27419]